MSLQLLLRDQPSRAFAIVTESHALVFRHSKSSLVGESQKNENIGRVSPSKGMVEFSAINDIDLSGYRVLRSSGIHGTLGLININTDVFLCLITSAARVASLRPGENVLKILSVVFYCMNRSDYDFELNESFDPYSDVVASAGYEPGQNAEAAAFEHPCFELQKMLSGGTFYYSVDCDLTNRLQDRASEHSAFDIDSLDEGFLWNAYMISPLIKFRSRLSAHEKNTLDSSKILTLAIRGFVSTITIPSSSSPVKSGNTHLPSNLSVLSRLSCRRAGTRFNSRGIDDDGNVANFVETETLFWHPSGLCFSYAQIRGSVPVFWEQATGLLPGQQKIQITRSPEATQPAFDKHFERLEVDYSTVHILNLLSESKLGEAELTARYRYHVQHSQLNQILDIGSATENRLLDSQFDFHAETKGPSGYEAANMVRRLISDRADAFAYFLGEGAPLSDPEKPHGATTVILQQEGVFRTNCLDCLDRSNLIQTILSQMALECFLEHHSERAASDFWMRHSSLWADNGDALSKIYAGTGALKSSFTRHGKISLAGAIADARKSATRMYINNFADKGRQNTIDMLLGRLIDQSPVQLYDPITDYVDAELRRRMNEYSTSASLQIWVGTFNLNGKISGARQDLAAWLCPQISQQRPDIVAVGFQEMVELSPQQIMSTDPDRRQVWEDAVGRTLNDDARKHSTAEFILLRSGQLVGAALMVFVKTTILSKIKNVEGSVKKTGMSGMAGNKGAVAIRMDYANTRLCFVTAHLAAGFANYEERNRDYRTISHGLRFQRNRSIEDHDTTIWLGDFNYRIGLSDEKVRHLINVGDLETLYQNDQLNLQMVAGQVFKHYSEARISFMPTYKYDNGTDNYDSSEKTRIPAWCDRILRKGDLKQINYNTAPLRFSDHRPVYATFQCAVNDIDEAKRESLSHDIYARRRADVGDTTANATNDDIVDEEDLIGYEPIAPELPPASSDRRKWWLDNGLPARSEIKPPNDQSSLNAKRPLNPFSPTEEADWVVVPKAPSYRLPDRSNSSTSIQPRNIMGKDSLPGKDGLPLSIDLSHDTITSGRREQAKIPSSPASDVSRASSQLTVASAISRKPAPPIPKKPTVLSSATDQSMGNTAKSTSRRNQDDARSQQHTDAQPKPDISATLPTPPAQSVRESMPRSPPDIDGPPLPPRRAVSRPSPNGLMDDDDAEGASTIPSLQPQRGQLPRDYQTLNDS